MPTFFAEYGCVNGGPRPFTEVLALYGPQMTKVWSGGVVYMYFAAASNPGYGKQLYTDALIAKLTIAIRNRVSWQQQPGY